MKKNAGGRGCKNPYTTMVKRIPEQINSEVDLLIEKLHSQIEATKIVDGDNNQPVLDRSSDQYSFLLPTQSELYEIAKEILKRKKSARESLTKMLQVIYNNPAIKL